MTSPALPEFGHPMLSEFLISPAVVNLNHGSYGTCPRLVQKSLQEFQTRSEATTDLWMRREAKIELKKIRQKLADFVSADVDDLVMVPNTTSGINAILRSMKFREGDHILHFSTTYLAMRRLIQFVADSSDGKVTPLCFNVIYPMSNDDLIQNLETFVDLHHDRNQTQDKRIRIALIDHITSAPGIRLPLEKILTMLHQRNISVLVDGAHAIGQVPINIRQLNPDYYVTNCHKWLYASRGCALLYVKRELQNSVHPALISAFYSQEGNFHDEFFWTGTMDYSPYMTVAAALEFRQAAGGEEAICTYTHNLAMEGGKLIADFLGSKILQSDGQIANMVDIELPLKNHNNAKFCEEFWVNLLLNRFNVIACPYTHAGKWFLRASAQIYNELEDFKKCAKTFDILCKEINEESSINKS